MKLTGMKKGYSIESKYSEDFAFGYRTELRSSLGLSVDLNLNKFGQTEKINVALGLPVDLIEASQVVEGGRAQREITETGVLIYERA